MKIYHTETQANYDALMVELERLGIQTLEKRLWKEIDNQTVVLVRAIGRYGNSTRTDTTYGSLGWALQHYPTVPIQKYKAKADEKMRFTKSNIEGLVNKYFDDNVGECPGNLIAEIYAMDDTPEKVVVPKLVAEFYDSIRDYILYEKFKAFETATHEDVSKWYMDFKGRHNNNRANAQEAIAKMDLYGYTIEPEKLYYIPLPDLETTDGIQQVLSKRENGTNYFAWRPTESVQQRYTKAELERVPEVYKQFAKPIEEEEE